MGERTNKREVIAGLNAALPHQNRCALGFALVAATLPGPEGVALSERLRAFAADELRDVERIVASATRWRPSSAHSGEAASRR